MRAGAPQPRQAVTGREPLMPAAACRSSPAPGPGRPRRCAMRRYQRAVSPIAAGVESSGRQPSARAARLASRPRARCLASVTGSCLRARQSTGAAQWPIADRAPGSRRSAGPKFNARRRGRAVASALGEQQVAAQRLEHVLPRPRRVGVAQQRAARPAAPARTRSGISRSRAQSPPPMTLPARAVATAAASGVEGARQACRRDQLGRAP